MPLSARPGRARRCACLGLLLLGFALSSHAAAEFTLLPVADGVFVHQGQQVGIEDPARGDSANLGVVLGQRCVAVIDTGGSVATGRALRAAIAALTPLPLCYVINTHAHFDHLLGNAAFADSGAQFVGHQELPATVAASEAYFSEHFAAERAGDTHALLPAEGVWVAASTRLDLGGRELLITAVPKAHSSADLTVLDAATATLFTGDLVFMQRLPVLDGSLRGWLAWLDAPPAQPIARIVPGHGPIAAPWPAAAAPERAYLEALQTEAKAAIKAGAFLEDVLANAESKPPAGWVLTGPHPRNMSKAFREFEWD